MGGLWPMISRKADAEGAPMGITLVGVLFDPLMEFSSRGEGCRGVSVGFLIPALIANRKRLF
jgi:hypothetical protein